MDEGKKISDFKYIPKTRQMKNLLIYYFQISWPLVALYFASKNGDSILFFALAVFYYFYRIFIDYRRLRSKNLVTKKDVFRFILPIGNVKYFKKLYFEK